MNFISFFLVQKHKSIAYANMICDHRPLTPGVNWLRLTIGEDVLDYLDNVSSLSVSLFEDKLLLNSIISDFHL